MAGLSSPGVGSGLDINTLISRLMMAEQQPLLALQKKEAGFQAKISALGSLKSSLSSLQTSAENMMPATGSTANDKYTTTKASLGDSSLVNVTATNSAAAGTHTFSDVTLASAQRLSKTGMTIPADAGTLSITVGAGSSIDVSINAGATLANIRDAINASGAEVSASILNDGNSDFLVLNAKNTGAANTITVAGSAGFEAFDYAEGGANAWGQTLAAADASVKIDGIVVSSPSNTITTAVEGVTLNLVKAGTASTTLTLSKEHSNVTSSVNGFIKAFNDAANTIKSLGNYNAETKKASTLTGDSALRAVDSQLHALLFSPSGSTGSNMQRLSDLGISLQLDGTLKLDATKLSSAIDRDFEGVANLMSNVGTRFKDTVTGMVGDSGIVSSRIDGAKSSATELTKRQEAMQLRLEKVESNYRRQFNALDSQLANMQSLSSQLSGQLSSLANLIGNR